MEQDINMRYICKTVLFLFFLLPVITMGQADIKDDTLKSTTSVKDTLSYTIYGMDCPGCEGGLEKQVNKLSFVKWSKSNWLTQKLFVVVKKDSVLNMEKLKAAVSNANFTVEEEDEDEK